MTSLDNGRRSPRKLLRAVVQRIRIADAFVESGLAVEDLGRLVTEGHITFPNLEAAAYSPAMARNSSTTC